MKHLEKVAEKHMQFITASGTHAWESICKLGEEFSIVGKEFQNSSNAMAKKGTRKEHEE